MVKKSRAQLHVTGTLLEGVAGMIPVFKKIDRACWKMRTAEVRNDGLLVFNARIIPIKLGVDGDSGIGCNVIGFNHDSVLPVNSFMAILYHKWERKSRGKAKLVLNYGRFDLLLLKIL